MTSLSDKLTRYLGALLFFRGMPRAMKLGFMVGAVGSLTGVVLLLLLKRR